MIHDNMLNFKLYAVPKTQAILKFIAENDCAKLPDGEIEILGRHLFVRVMSYIPKPAENRFETHQIYADMQYVVSGAEIIQTARMKDLTSLTEYDETGDFQFYKVVSGARSDLVVETGEFAFFYPYQPHRPSCVYEGYERFVKKLVFKIKIN